MVLTELHLVLSFGSLGRADPTVRRNGQALFDHSDQRIALAADLRDGRLLGARKQNSQSHARTSVLDCLDRRLRSQRPFLGRYIPLSKIPLPKAQSKVIHTFTSDQVYKLLHQCQISNGTGHVFLSIFLKDKTVLF